MKPSLEPKRGIWLRAILALELIWIVAGVAVFYLRSTRPTAAEVIAFLRLQDVEHLQGDDRKSIMRDASKRLAALSYAELEEVRISRALFGFYRHLTPAEKEAFATLVVPSNVRRTLDASRSVAPEQRARFLHKALYLGVIDFVTANPRIDPDAIENIQRKALRSYFESLTAEERLAMEFQFRTLREVLAPVAPVAP